MPGNKILISGAGSIGQRHLRNLRSLGIEDIVVADPNGAGDYADFEEALTKEQPSIVFICSPTKLHVPQALAAIRANAHVFIEKPLSNTMDGVEELKHEAEQQKRICMVGCNMRFHPGPAKVKELIDAGTIGTITEATVYTGSYLPEWRPQQDYKKSYSADPAQGGAILDCIHEIDLALWYLGPATLTKAMIEPATSIGLSVEGTADLDLRHLNGATSTVHLSFMEKEYRRFCEITGSDGSIRWDFGEEKVVVRDPSGAIIETYPAGGDINQMYIDEVSHFLRCCEENQEPQGNLKEAGAALEIALQAKKHL